jgi:hypothetical protein
MKTGALAEAFPGENRVAMTPDSATQLAKLGHTCVIESGAGAKAGFSDAAYAAAGVTVLSDAKAVFDAADVVVKVRGPEASEAALLKSGQTLISFFWPAQNADLLKQVADAGATVVAIWYYEMPLPEGRKKYSKTAPMAYEEFADCLAWWKKREPNERAWKVSAADLIQRDAQDRVVACNLDIKNPHSGEVADHRAPAEIVDAIIAQEQRILGIMDEIKAVLAERV